VVLSRRFVVVVVVVFIHLVFLCCVEEVIVLSIRIFFCLENNPRQHQGRKRKRALQKASNQKGVRHFSNLDKRGKRQDYPKKLSCQKSASWWKDFES